MHQHLIRGKKFFSYAYSHIVLLLLLWSFFVLEKSLREPKRLLIAGFTIHILILLIYVYLMARPSQMTNRAIWVWFILFSLPLLLTPPLFSTDAYKTIFMEQVLIKYRLNPYTINPLEFAYEPLVKFVYWNQFGAHYGPLWTILAAPIGFLGANILTAVLGLKLILLGCIALAAKAIKKISEIVAPGHSLESLKLFLWNPAILILSLLETHNDISMVACIVIAVLFFLKDRVALSILSLTVGFLIKYTALLLMPVFIVWAIQKKAYRELFIGLASSTIISTALFQVFGLEHILANLGQVANSRFDNALLYNLSALGFVPPSLDLSKISILLSIIIVGGLTWYGSRTRDLRQRILIVSFILAIPLFTALEFFSWFLIWPIALFTTIARRYSFIYIFLTSFSMLQGFTHFWAITLLSAVAITVLTLPLFRPQRLS